MQEHRRDVRAHRTSNSLVVHIDERGHLPKWDETQILSTGSSKTVRKVVEAAHIATRNNTNHRDGFVCLAKSTAEEIAKTRSGLSKWPT